MPYFWTDTDQESVLTLYPHRSLTTQGFAWVIGVTAAMLSLPLLAVVGSKILWGLLPFVIIAVWGLWRAIMKSWQSAEVQEELRLSHDLLQLRRDESGGGSREWRANPYWVRLTLRDGPVPDYLTLAAEGQEKELGAFLTPPERRALATELKARLSALR